MLVPAQAPLNSAQKLTSPFCLKIQVEEKKVESPLADYNSPSPTFSVETTKPLISGFVASTMGTCVSLQSAVFLLPLHSTCKPDS